MNFETLSDDTIVAVATAQGTAAIGIVRLSGKQALRIAKTLCGRSPQPRLATLCTITDPQDGPFDQAIVIYFPAPRSYTGEDIVEVQTHGGAAVTEKALNCCVAGGARIARPGEFSERAFLNGKIDLLQAEAIADLIASGSERAARSAYRSMTGAFSEQVHRISNALTEARVELEAYIDFPDEDLPGDVVTALNDRIAEQRQHVSKVIDAARLGARLGRGLEVAIVGRPNVGKSTLLNVLARQERAITSDTPGTTRDVVSVEAEYEGVALHFHDTAGIRPTASDDVEAEGIRRSKTVSARADVTLYVSDDWQEQTPDELRAQAGELIFVLNKIDIEGLTAGKVARGGEPAVRLSAKTGDGVETLISTIVDYAGLADNNASTFFARERHINALLAALDALGVESAEMQSAPEVTAERLRIAQRALGQLTGEYTSEDLLGDIFSTFCIGK